MAAGYEDLGSGPERTERQQDSWAMPNRPPDADAGRSPGSGVNAKSVTDHLSSLLLSAEGTARRIIEEAEAKARDHVANLDQRARRIEEAEAKLREEAAGLDRRARRVEEETARLASWSRQTEKLIQTLWSAFSEFRRDVDSVQQRINEALAPLGAHIPGIIRQIDQLTSSVTSPAFEAPSFSSSPSAETPSAPGPARSQGFDFMSPPDGQTAPRASAPQAPEGLTTVSPRQVEGGWTIDPAEPSRVPDWDDFGNGTP